MIKSSSIQAVKDTQDIVKVIGHYIKLDRYHKACCPFHEEKTPSFSVDPKREIFKCFGCGEGGDAIAFVEKHEHCTFKEAIEKIAAIVGVHLEYEEIVDKAKHEAEETMREQMAKALQFAISSYRQQLWNLPADHPIRKYIRERKLTENEVAEWQLGWSGTDWRSITPSIIAQNLYNAAEKLGLVKRGKDDSNYDAYRSRVSIPIQDHKGKFIGIAGRYIMNDEREIEKCNDLINEAQEKLNANAITQKEFDDIVKKARNPLPKYVNPCENELYSKSRVLFGLSKAIKAIKELKFAYLVEGYFDVISMHKGGHRNTVASCGTALTDAQCKLLSRYTNHICILRDADEAGMKAATKDLSILLRNGFKVSIIVLPEGEDPDSFVIKQMGDETGEDFMVLLPQMEDAILWNARVKVEDAKDDPFKVSEVKKEVIKLLLQTKDSVTRTSYLETLYKKHKWKVADLQKELAKAEETEDGIEHFLPEESNLDKMPAWMNKEQFLINGFCEVRNKQHFGYYSWGASGKVELTNFLIKPLIHIYAAKESRYMIQIDNGRKKAVLDIEAKAMISPDLLAQYVVSEGAFIIYGFKAQMLRIANYLLQQFPLCREVEFLGYQQAGFFAFVDKIFIPKQGLKDIDDWGVIKHEDNNYLVPAASAAYKQVQNSAGDPYENLRTLTFVESPINFSQWATLMYRVYQYKGIVAVAYAILTVFRDIIFSIDNNCPHLYGFGERSSGKTKWAESVSAFFFSKRQAFNLNSGTDFAFNNYMALFINCPAVLNEADEKVLKPEWFQIIKGAYDGEGRQRGVIGSKNKTEIQKIQSTLILIGQYLMTTDDNSIVSRSLIESFTERELTEEDKQQYTKLKDYEEAGLTSLITELIEYRKEFKALYKEVFNRTLGDWRRTLNNDGGSFNQRIMQNWCHLYTCYFIIGEFHKLPVSNEVFEDYCKKRAVHWSNFIRASDTLSEFWNTFEFLVDQGIIIPGWHFRIESMIRIKIRNESKEANATETERIFNEPTKILFLRLNLVHKLYQQAYRNRTGKEGMTLENLKHYFSGRKYYLGSHKQSRFKRFAPKTEETKQNGIKTIDTKKVLEEQTSSSYSFLYEHLGIDIERNQPAEFEDEEQQRIEEETGDKIPF